MLNDLKRLKLCLILLTVCTFALVPNIAKADQSVLQANTGTSGVTIAPGITFGGSGPGTPSSFKPEVFVGFEAVTSTSQLFGLTYTSQTFEWGGKIGPYISTPGNATSLSNQASALLDTPDMGILFLGSVNYNITDDTKNVLSVYAFGEPIWRVMTNFATNGQYTQDAIAEGLGIQLRVFQYILFGDRVRLTQWGALANDVSVFRQATGISDTNSIDNQFTLQVPFQSFGKVLVLQMNVSGYLRTEQYHQLSDVFSQNLVQLGLATDFDVNSSGAKNNQNGQQGVEQ
jgi:hypothetical protein